MAADGPEERIEHGSDGSKRTHACASAAVNGAGALVFLAFGAGRDQRYDEPRGGGGGLGAAAVAPLGAKLLADDDGAASGSS